LLCNIGTGIETGVNDLYAAMAHNAGVNQPPIYVQARPGELQRSCLDPGRAGLHLGWKPWTTISAGTAGVLDWWRAHPPTA
jgi:UDP-glucose 4-epimerase